MRSSKGCLIVRAGAQARTFFAGFGVSGSLLAAVGVVALLAGGVLAFDQWPRELSSAPRESVEVAAAQTSKAPATAQPRAVALPAATPITSSRRSGRRGTTASGRTSRKPTTGVGGRPTPPGTNPVTPTTT